ASGAIVGSRFVSLLEEGGDAEKAVKRLIEGLKE
ncbi:MAG: tryptophan synthase subunit alpha, partial [Mediterranea sp.]|nr:tryptophan synthase subunit alpha [Mediterranea sp.]